MSYSTSCPTHQRQPAGQLPTFALRFDLFQKRVRIRTQQAANFDELDDIQPTVRVFDFGNERLRATKLVRQLLLRHISIVPGFDQKPDQGQVSSIVD